MDRQLVVTQRRCMGGEAALLECGAGCSQLLPTAPVAMNQDRVTGIGHPRRMTPAGTSGGCIELAGWRPGSNRSVKRVRTKQQLSEQNSVIGHGSSPTWSR